MIRDFLDRWEHSLEWLLGDDTHAADFILVVLICTAMAYFAWQVIRWL